MKEKTIIEAVARGLIEAADLVPLLDARDIRILDASYGPTQGLDPDVVFASLRIGQAGRFDIDLVTDQGAALPHTVPDAAGFAQHCEAAGLKNDDFIVIYDQTGIAFAAARAWWMFRLFGHDRVCVLNGGLPAWRQAGFEVTEGSAPPLPAAPAGSFKTFFRPELLSGLDSIKNALRQPSGGLIVDARSAGRFSGREPEPRPGMRAGHIPGSMNLPYASLLDSRGALRSADELADLLNGSALPADRITTTCGSGVTACVVALALFQAGRPDVSVYDGSWTEWGNADSHTPVSTAG